MNKQNKDNERFFKPKRWERDWGYPVENVSPGHATALSLPWRICILCYLYPFYHCGFYMLKRPQGLQEL